MKNITLDDFIKNKEQCLDAMEKYEKFNIFVGGRHFVMMSAESYGYLSDPENRMVIDMEQFLEFLEKVRNGEISVSDEEMALETPES